MRYIRLMKKRMYHRPMLGRVSLGLHDAFSLLSSPVDGSRASFGRTLGWHDPEAFESENQFQLLRQRRRDLLGSTSSLHNPNEPCFARLLLRRARTICQGTLSRCQEVKANFHRAPLVASYARLPSLMATRSSGVGKSAR